MCASIEFLSHPDPKKSLDVHCNEVGVKARELCSGLNINCQDAAYYAGVLHDIGKLNPVYQIPFNLPKNPGETSKQFETRINEQMQLLHPTYIQQHATFSAWAAYKLLDGTTLTEKQKMQTICAINGHHTRLQNNVVNQNSNAPTFIESQKAIASYLKEYKTRIGNSLDELDWQSCYDQYEEPISVQTTLESDNTLWQTDFLESGMIFSTLLQADRGSFRAWQTPQFDLTFDTSSLVKQSALSDHRSQFNKTALENHDYNASVSVLKAPTGIGKTKVFLDLVNEYCNPSDKKRNAEKFERVFYFSPLLALTDDFGDKIEQIMTDQQLKDVIEYNHLFSSTLLEKIENKQQGKIGLFHKDFEYESFNKKFIIATTQRLLMLIYSNRISDKIKLASLKNSLLIIDEIQTIPKFLIPNFVQMLQVIGDSINSKILLVSATIPAELTEFHLPTTQPPETLYDDYLNQTQKIIQYQDTLEIPDTYGKLLVMANTRRKAREIFENNVANNPSYLTAGVTKYHRLQRIKIVKEASPENQSMTVATQVIEAGVDVSFSQIYREVAPLENIVQVMGRLNREGESENPVLTVYRNTSVTPEHIPYTELEWRESHERIQNIQNSQELYDELPRYYDVIFRANQTNRNLAEQLQNEMIALNFQDVWEFVRQHIGDIEQDSIFIPRTEKEWNDVKTALLDEERRRDARKRYAVLTASLPGGFNRLSNNIVGFADMFDADLREESFLMPNWDDIERVYDQNIGLDRWL